MKKKSKKHDVKIKKKIDCTWKCFCHIPFTAIVINAKCWMIMIKACKIYGKPYVCLTCNSYKSHSNYGGKTVYSKLYKCSRYTTCKIKDHFSMRVFELAPLINIPTVEFNWCQEIVFPSTKLLLNMRFAADPSIDSPLPLLQTSCQGSLGGNYKSKPLAAI